MLKLPERKASFVNRSFAPRIFVSSHDLTQKVCNFEGSRLEAQSLQEEQCCVAFFRLVMLLPLASSAAFAQSWPTRQVITIVPQSAGSALDIVTRAVMEQVSTRLGQPIMVENRLGAGNTIAMAAVARAEPDGYTILANSSTHSLVPVTYGNLPFDTFRDLTPIIPISNTPWSWWSHPRRGTRTLRNSSPPPRPSAGP